MYYLQNRGICLGNGGQWFTIWPKYLYIHMVSFWNRKAMLQWTLWWREGRHGQGAAWTVALCSFGMTEWRHLRQDMKEKSAARSDRAKIAEKVLHVEPTQPTPVEEARPRQPPSTCLFGNRGKGRAQGQNCIVQVKLKPPSKEFKIGQAVRCPVEFQMEHLKSTTQ